MILAVGKMKWWHPLEYSLHAHTRIKQWLKHICCLVSQQKKQVVTLQRVVDDCTLRKG